MSASEWKTQERIACNLLHEICCLQGKQNKGADSTKLNSFGVSIKIYISELDIEFLIRSVK